MFLSKTGGSRFNLKAISSTAAFEAAQINIREFSPCGNDWNENSTNKVGASHLWISLMEEGKYSCSKTNC